MAVAALLLLPWSDVVPGLHFDEAWTFDRVDELARGARPLSGWTFYTGAIYSYLVWPFVAALGETTTALRLLGVILNLATVGLVASAVGQIRGPRIALAAGALLATSPAFVAFSRFAIEVTALSPFLVALAFRAFVAAAANGSRGLRAHFCAIGGGAALGLLWYNHVVQLPIALAAGFGMLLGTRGRLLGWPAFYAGLAGLLVGSAPRLVEIVRAGGVAAWIGASPARGSFLPDLLHLPGVLLRTWDGHWIYQRFAGGSWLPVLPYPVIALVLLFAWRRRTRPGFASIVAVGSALAAALLITAVGPHLSLRYFVVFHYAAPLWLAFTAARLLEPGSGMGKAAGRPASASVVAGGVLAVVVGLNLLYLGTNFFTPFLSRGGGVSVFPIGTRLLETSNHFVRTDLLYDALLREEIVAVDTESAIEMPLRRQAAGRRSFVYRPTAPSAADPSSPDLRTAIVFYNGPTARGWKPSDGWEDTRRWPDVIGTGTLRFRRSEAFPPLFRVYVSGPK